MTALNTTNSAIRYINAPAVAARAAEFATGQWSSTAVTGATALWYQNCMNGASNAPGIGIGTQTFLQTAPGSSGVPQQSGWTLNDQFGASGTARTAVAGNQKSQHIGGNGTSPAPSFANKYSSGGIEGNGTTTLLISVVNVPNTGTGSTVPNPLLAPTLNNGGTGTATVEMLSLAAGWTAVGL